jgi:hypothetical protein
MVTSVTAALRRFGKQVAPVVAAGLEEDGVEVAVAAMFAEVYDVRKEEIRSGMCLRECPSRDSPCNSVSFKSAICGVVYGLMPHPQGLDSC